MTLIRYPYYFMEVLVRGLQEVIQNTPPSALPAS
jgi:hypothetical protein